MINIFFCFFYLECVQLKRESFNWLYACLFFCIVISLIPLAFNSDLLFLKTYFSGYIWIAALLSSLIATQNFFSNENEDGFLEQLLFHQHHILIYIYAKLCAHWLWLVSPLLIITPLLGLAIGLPTHIIMIDVFSLMLATPILTLINAFSSSLTHQLKSQSGLISIISLPLLIPVIIFAIEANKIAQQYGDPTSAFAFMGAILILCVSVVPFAMASVLKLVMRN